MAKAVAKVTGFGAEVTEKQLEDFFEHSGKIDSMELKTLEGEGTRVALVTFEEADSLQKALILNGSEIGGHKLTVEIATGFEPLSVEAASGNEAPSNDEPSDKVSEAPKTRFEQAQKMIADMMAKGHVVSVNAMEKAKAFDDKHQISRQAAARMAAIGASARELGVKSTTAASELDKKVGISEKVAAGIEAVNDKVNVVDEKYQLSDKTRSVFEKAEVAVAGALSVGQQKATQAGVAIGPYVASGQKWVMRAVEKFRSGARKGKGEEVEKGKESEGVDKGKGKEVVAGEGSEGEVKVESVVDGVGEKGEGEGKAAAVV